jgi:hypothetical protein
MSYQLIEHAVVAAVVLGALLSATARWWPARLQPIKRWRKGAASGCGSGCGGCSSGTACTPSSRPVNTVQVVRLPHSKHQAR